MTAKKQKRQKQKKQGQRPSSPSKTAQNHAHAGMPLTQGTDMIQELPDHTTARANRQLSLLRVQQSVGNAQVSRFLASRHLPPHLAPLSPVPGDAVQRFGSEEHRQLGAEGSGNTTLDIDLGDGTRLTYGEMVALAGDYFGSISEMQTLAATPAGQEELRWARWQAMRAGGEPDVSQAAKDRVMDRYYRLAANNISHFSAGGTARTEYQNYHAQALHQAFMAGANENLATWGSAVATEAFGNHFLTDMFSAGHVRTPRAAIKEWYQTHYPNSVDQFVNYAANTITETMDRNGDVPWYWPNSSVAGRIRGRIRDLGGSAIDSFSLGDVVSLAYHDHDNAALGVVSDVNPEGQPVDGGYHWTAKGDSHLADSPITRQMAVAAVRTSLNDLELMRVAGQRATANQCLSPEALETEFHLALSTVQPYAAEGYIPREDPTAGNAFMSWEWGSINPEMRTAIDTAVKGEIANTLRGKAASVPEVMRLNRRGGDDPDGAVTLHVRQAFNAFCDHLGSDGIVAIENAMNTPASPLPDEQLDAGVPLPAGVPAMDAGVP